MIMRDRLLYIVRPFEDSPAAQHRRRERDRRVKRARAARDVVGETDERARKRRARRRGAEVRAVHLREVELWEKRKTGQWGGERID